MEATELQGSKTTKGNVTIAWTSSGKAITTYVAQESRLEPRSDTTYHRRDHVYTHREEFFGALREEVLLSCCATLLPVKYFQISGDRKIFLKIDQNFTGKSVAQPN